MIEYIDDQNYHLFGLENMSLSDLETPWINTFAAQVTASKHQRPEHQSMCRMSDLPQPRPQRLSIDAPFLYDSDEEHHLENALKDMMDKGEFEDFLIDNTISLQKIQDDINVIYGNNPSDGETLPKPRARRHSIGSTEEIIRCPFPGCSKIFNRSYNFKSHIKIHSGERPYKCNSCELSFARCHDLKRHEKIHDKNNMSQNECKFCGKNFSRPDALNRHIKFNACQKRSF